MPLCFTISPPEPTDVGKRQWERLPWPVCSPCCPVTIDEQVQQQDVLWGEPIVGVEQVTLDENGPGARDATAPITPKAPTRAQRERHFLTHLPYAAWCPFCVAARRPNSHHQHSHEHERELPLLVADYGFLRDEQDQDMVSMLVIKVYPYKLVFATVVDVKGPDPAVVDRVARFIKESGLVRFSYRADREPAVQSLLEEAIKKSGRHGVPDETADPQYAAPSAATSDDRMETIAHEDGTYQPIADVPVMTAAPEHSQPGESQSNGLAERTIQSVKDLILCHKTSFESGSRESIR